MAILKWLWSPCSFGFLEHHVGDIGVCPPLGNLCSVPLMLLSVCTKIPPGTVCHEANLLNDSEGCEATDMVHLFVTKCVSPPPRPPQFLCETEVERAKPWPED